ncbi:MAG: phosphotransferase [Actinomycetales bacterium]|nr:phosphotransferase [Actinomycetales bacterium]
MSAEVDEAKLARELSRSFGVSGTISRIHSGTATDNFQVDAGPGQRWFAKVYRDQSVLPDELAAIDLTTFAGSRGVPVPALHPTVTGHRISDTGDIAMSLWEYVEGAETAELGLSGGRWATVGAVLGTMHRHLAQHPAYRPSSRPATALCDLPAAQARYDQLIEAYRHRPALDDDQAWALDTALHRRSLLPQVEPILLSLPPQNVQIAHGDLAAPNVMMRGDDVAAVIDFQPPSPHFVAWEIARIGCDPRTIASGTDWLTGLSLLLDAYEQENPAVHIDLRAVVTTGCAYTLASTYPLSAPLKPPTVDHAGLIQYGHDRHRAALEMLEVLRTDTRVHDR